mmetsp:Transcript_11788/g.25410  ORF Transcript_11788/g.25410 Transcript_11788/m.25410 type:complete len:204 (-) Transcript_11788:24-635(-)
MAHETRRTVNTVAFTISMIVCSFLSFVLSMFIFVYAAVSLSDDAEGQLRVSVAAINGCLVVILGVVAILLALAHSLVCFKGTYKIISIRILYVLFIFGQVVTISLVLYLTVYFWGTLPLSNSFPDRCTSNQVPGLNPSLGACVNAAMWFFSAGMITFVTMLVALVLAVWSIMNFKLLGQAENSDYPNNSPRGDQPKQEVSELV